MARSKGEVDAMLRGVEEKYERVDILVNNAGIHGFGPPESVTTELCREIYDTNVLGLMLASTAALPLFSESGGAIINIWPATTHATSPARHCASPEVLAWGRDRASRMGTAAHSCDPERHA